MHLAELLAEISSEIMTRDQVQRHIFDLTHKSGGTWIYKADPEEYKRRWLPSSTFFLMCVALDKVNAVRPAHNPDIVKCKVETPDPEPIIIDKNVPSAYRTDRKPKPWPGKTLVMDGAHRTAAALTRKDKTIMAWIGERCISDFM